MSPALRAGASLGACTVAGYQWDATGLALILHLASNESHTLALPPDSPLRFTETSMRRCIGCVDFERLIRVPCPAQSAVGGTLQCSACARREGFLPCVRCKGRDCPPLPPAVRAYCTGPHHLYLACFGDSRVKVGTASAPRRAARLLEQGPLAAAYIAMADGPTIKRLEHEVACLGYASAVRRRQRGALLLSMMSAQTGRRHVADAYETISRRLMPSMRNQLHPLEYVPLPEWSFDGDVAQVKEITLEPGQTLNATVLRARGSFLMIEEGGIPGLLDVAALTSHLLHMNPAVDGSPPVRQLGLLLTPPTPGR
jgi:hypothetical protein